MLAAVNSSAAIDVCTTRSGASLWKCAILGFWFASFFGLKTGCCFISRTGGDVSLRIDSPAVTSGLRPWTGPGATEFAALAADDLEASMIRGTVMIAPKSRTAVTRTMNRMRIPVLLRVEISNGQKGHRL